MPPHILMLLLTPYRPDPRVERETKTLSRRGYRVSVIAWNRRGDCAPHEKHDDMQLLSLGPSIPRSLERSRMGVFLGKAFATLFFYVNAIVTGLRLKPEILHSHDLDTLIPGVVLKWLMHSKLVFDSHENYPALLLEDLGQIGYWTSLAVQKLLIRFPDVVIASNEAVSRSLRHHKRVFLVKNFVDLEWFDAVSGGPTNLIARPMVIYAGVLIHGRGLEQLFEAVQLVRPEIDVVVAGEGPLLKDLKTECERRNIHVEFRSSIDRGLFPHLIRTASIGVALFQPTPNNIGILPNKLFEYMAGGLPVIVSDFPLMRELVLQNECGMVVDPTSPHEIAQAIEFLASNPSEARRMGANGRKIVEDRYSWRSNEAELLETYAAL